MNSPVRSLSAYHFVTDERDISQRLGIVIEHPIRVLDLDALGIDKQRFLADLAPTFYDLPWDLYDVKRNQAEQLMAQFPGEKGRLEKFLAEYYADHADLGAVQDLLERVAPEARGRIEGFEPYRRRSVCKFSAQLDASGSWKLQQMAMQSFTQKADSLSDYRKFPRVFAPTPTQVTGHPGFQAFLQAVADIVHEVRPEAARLEITAHQMSLVVGPSRPVNNSPEGIHQDGADYIVSALVVERTGVEGGMSRTFGPDKKTIYLQHILQPGEGLFQADLGSPLWHDVTDVRLANPGSPEKGRRSIIGLDIRVVS